MKKQIVATSRERGDVCDLKRSGGAQRESFWTVSGNIHFCLSSVTCTFTILFQIY